MKHRLPVWLLLLLALLLSGCGSSSAGSSTSQTGNSAAATQPATTSTPNRQHAVARHTHGLARNRPVLPGNLLIADEDNNRLIEVNPAKKIVWQFPQPGDLAKGQTFNLPDDAFFSPAVKRSSRLRKRTRSSV